MKWLVCLLISGCGFESRPPPLFTVVNQDDSGLYLQSLWGSSAKDVFAGGDGGRIYHYDGIDWSLTGSVPTALTITGLWGSGPKDLFAVGADDPSTQGIILHFDGVFWTVGADLLSQGLLSVWGGGSDRWASGSAGALYHKSGDADWLAQPSLPENPSVLRTGEPFLNSIAGLSPDSILITGDQQALYYFDGAWSPIFRPNDGHFFTVAWAGDSQIYVGGSQYAIWRFTPPDQLDLVYEEDALSFRFRGVWGSDSRHLVFVGEAGKILTWDGTHAKSFDAGVTYDFEAVWGSSPDDVWIVGADSAIVHAQHLF